MRRTGMRRLAAVVIGMALGALAGTVAKAGGCDDGTCQRGGQNGYGAAAHGHGRRGHCGQGHCGQGHCGQGSCGQGHCGQRCPPAWCGPGCLDCLHGMCDGHCLHHDVYEKRYFLRSQGKSWHSAWYDPAEGRPIALVVPPTAEFQTQYGWGVPSSRVMPIYHQFRRPYPGPGGVAGAGGRFLPTPAQPSDTVQFGVNPVRGPWGAY